MKKLKIKNIIVLCILLLLMIFSNVMGVYGAIDETDYVLYENKKVSIPVSYNPTEVISYLGEEYGLLNSPRDIFVDSFGLIYIVDTGNNRIIKMNDDYVVLEAFYGPAGYELKNPQGIFVDDEGDMYVADTDNARILHLSPSGEFVEEFVKPLSELYSSSSGFKPSKVAIDDMGNLIIINKNDYHGFIVMDAYNEFQQYFAPTPIGFSARDVLIRIFASQEQKDRLSKRLPPANSNFEIGNDGMVYVAVLRKKTAQISKLSPIGINIFPEKGYFGESIDDMGRANEPAFVDITVNEKGNVITTLDNSSGKIYQYDSDGHVLAVFGGEGNWKGKFIDPVALGQDGHGNLFVVDSKLNNIQVFERTEFIKNVHQALDLYYDGKYEEAIEPWQHILKSVPAYQVAHIGLGKAFNKQKKYNQAMQEFKKANYSQGYSQVFDEFRHNIFRDYFGFVVFGFALLVIVIILLLKRVVRYGIGNIRKTISWNKGV